MPQIPIENNDRMSLRVSSRDKSLILKAASLEQTNLTEFVVRNTLAAAQKIIEKHDQLHLSRKDSLLALNLLDNPPKPNKKLLAATTVLPDLK